MVSSTASAYSARSSIQVSSRMTSTSTLRAPSAPPRRGSPRTAAGRAGRATRAPPPGQPAVAPGHPVDVGLADGPAGGSKRRGHPAPLGDRRSARGAPVVAIAHAQVAHPVGGREPPVQPGQGQGVAGRQRPAPPGRRQASGGGAGRCRARSRPSPRAAQVTCSTMARTAWGVAADSTASSTSPPTTPTARRSTVTTTWRTPCSSMSAPASRTVALAGNGTGCGVATGRPPMPASSPSAKAPHRSRSVTTDTRPGRPTIA